MILVDAFYTGSLFSSHLLRFAEKKIISKNAKGRGAEGDTVKAEMAKRTSENRRNFWRGKKYKKCRNEGSFLTAQKHFNRDTTRLCVRYCTSTWRSVFGLCLCRKIFFVAIDYKTKHSTRHSYCTYLLLSAYLHCISQKSFDLCRHIILVGTRIVRTYSFCRDLFFSFLTSFFLLLFLFPSSQHAFCALENFTSSRYRPRVTHFQRFRYARPH